MINFPQEISCGKLLARSIFREQGESMVCVSVVNIETVIQQIHTLKSVGM